MKNSTHDIHSAFGTPEDGTHYSAIQVPEKNQRVLDYFKLKGKIDPLAVLQALNFRPHPGQQMILDALTAKMEPGPEAEALGLPFEFSYRTLVVACGRRFGKSYFAASVGAEELLYPNARVLVCSYRLENCKVIFRQIKDFIDQLGIEIVVQRNKELELELINGSTLSVASNDNVESRLGNSVSLLIIDEAKLFKRSLYEQFLEPQLLDYSPYSRTIMISSPEEGWLEDYYDKGQSKDPEVADFWSISLPTSINPAISKEFLAKLKARIPEDIWEQEYEGKFVSKAGKVVKEFDRDKHVFDEDMYPHFWEWVRNGRYVVVHTIDSGYSHYFAGIYFVYQEELDTVFVFGEYMLNKAVTEVHAENINGYEKEHRFEPAVRYADPAAAQQIADLATHDLYYNKAEKNLRETINCVNTFFYQTGPLGNPRLLVHRECRELLRQISTLRWAEDKRELARENAAGGTKPFKPDLDRKTDWDLFDAFRYGMFSYFKGNQVDLRAVEISGEDSEEAGFYTEMAQKGWFSAQDMQSNGLIY